MFELPPLTPATIVRRYKRFLTDVVLETGETVVAHCANTGAMTGCWEHGAPVQLSASNNPKRKLDWSLERVDMGQGWIGVNTARTNPMIGHFLSTGVIPGLSDYEEIIPEPIYQPLGYNKSRFDFRLGHRDKKKCFIEVKNTTLIIKGQAAFPDAVTTRGQKHLNLLAHAVEQGYRAMMLYAVNRSEGEYFTPARDIDPQYAELLSSVIDAGVEVVALRIIHTDTGMAAGELLPVQL